MVARIPTGLVLLAGLGCWQPPDLPPPTELVPPSEAELLAARPYVVTVPVAYSEQFTWPLVMVLHGYGGTGEVTSDYLGLTALLHAERAFLVAPNGLYDSQHNRAWHPSPVHSPPWDVEYLTAVVHDLKAKYRIDPARVWVVGHSQGAHMAHRVACDDAAELAAVVAFAGQLRDCAPSQPVAALQIHGTEDEAIGYFGDVNVPGDPTIPSAHETIGEWVRADGCTGPLAATAQTLDLVSDLPGNETSVEAASGCPAGIDVALWTMNGGLHRPLLTADFAPALYGFLEAHPRR